MKNLASKRFSEEAKKFTADGLAVLQSRVEKASVDLNKLRSTLSDRFFQEQVRVQPQEDAVENAGADGEVQNGLKEEGDSRNGSTRGSDKHSGGKGGKGKNTTSQK